MGRTLAQPSEVPLGSSKALQQGYPLWTHVRAKHRAPTSLHPGGTKQVAALVVMYIIMVLILGEGVF